LFSVGTAAHLTKFQDLGKGKYAGNDNYHSNFHLNLNSVIGGYNSKNYFIRTYRILLKTTNV